MQPERRKEIRSIVTQQPHGKLHILIGDQCIDVHKVKELSQTGMRLKVGKLVEISENILVRFDTKMIVLKLNGTVVWSSIFVRAPGEAEEQDAYLVGIKLTSRSLLETLW